MSDLVIGLTGGIGSGKTTVSDQLTSYGITIVDADIVAREVVTIGTEGLGEIINRFGTQILLPDGQLDRKRLREIIFQDEDEKHWLNNLLHPLIRHSLLSQIKRATSPYCVLSAPLLFENNLQQYVNRTLLIDINQDIQIQRASQRDGVEEEQIKTIIASQMSSYDKRELADDVIDNSSLTFAELSSAVEKYHNQYLKLVKNR